MQHSRPVKANQHTRWEGRSAQHKYDNMEKQLTCTICYENPVQALVRPCNHVSMCLACFNRYKTARCSRTADDHSALRCPICRTAADDVWPVSIGAAV